MDVILIIGLIVLLIVALAVILGWAEQRKKNQLEAEKRIEQEKALSRQAAKEKMQVAVVANHGDEPLEEDQTDISDNDLNKIKAAYAKFEKDVLGWEAKLQVKSEFSADEEALIRKEQLKYRMYFEEAFYEKHGNSVASQEWRQWTDAFSELLERHARLIAEEELPSEDDEEDDEEVETVETQASNQMPSETASQKMPSENHQAAEANEGVEAESLPAAGQNVVEAEAVAAIEDNESAAALRSAAFPAGFTAAVAPRAEVDEDELKGRERELWEYANRRNLSKREAGDRYERYLGYLYERAGWRVEYYGLTEGVANSNRGIDLICEKDGITHFVQTKYWSDGVVAKTNVNNVIDRIVKNMQGIIDKRAIRGDVQAVLAAKPKLSEQVAAYAQEQGVLLLDDLAVQPYPLVKCHTGKRGSKKYFLPYLADKNPAKYEEIRQGAWEPYDLVRMDTANGDVYVHTIEEAETLGYKYSNRA
ncbi:hypothetical protein [Neisseria yangbaofengii]|uniref:hypothetical protein n=1 Tax=Neisseria yangbaofengii TaxID=2709396 RepID=UPI0013ED8020|nr:hypothetical protein [Neisseria yangbaofengii]